MKKRYRRKRYSSKVLEVISNHLECNIKEYFIISIVFLIGIIIGILFINNTSNIQKEEITTYITSFITELKEKNDINDILLLLDSIKRNIFIAIFLWFIGSTILGTWIIYLTICFRGFCLGYSISSVILTLGGAKGALFTILTMFLHNLIFIPCIFIIAVSGIKLHNNIVSNKFKFNIKHEMIKHTAVSFLTLILLVVSSFIEVYLSKNLLLFFIKYL